MDLNASTTAARNSSEAPLQSLILKQYGPDDFYNHNIRHDFLLSITICLSLFLLFLILFFVCLCYNDVRWQGCLKRKKQGDEEEGVSKSVRKKRSTIIEPSVEIRTKRSTMNEPSVKRRTKRSTIIEQSVKRKSKLMSKKISPGEKSIIRNRSSRKEGLSLKIPAQRHTVYEFCNFPAGDEPISAIWTIEGDREMKTRSLMVSRQENFRISRSVSYKDPILRPENTLSRVFSSPDGRTFRRASSIEGIESLHAGHHHHNHSAGGSFNRRASSFEHREVQRMLKSRFQNRTADDEDITRSLTSLNSIDFEDATSASSGEFDFTRFIFSNIEDRHTNDGQNRERKTSKISIVVTNEDDGVSEVVHDNQGGIDYTEIQSSSSSKGPSSASGDDSFSVVVTRSESGVPGDSQNTSQTISLKEIVVDNRKTGSGHRGIQNSWQLELGPSTKAMVSPNLSFRSNRSDVNEPIIEEAQEEEETGFNEGPTTQL